MSDNSFVERQQDWTYELGHSLGLGHSYFNSQRGGNIMAAYLSGTTTLGWQDMQDYDYLNTTVW